MKSQNSSRTSAAVLYVVGRHLAMDVKYYLKGRERVKVYCAHEGVTGTDEH